MKKLLFLLLTATVFFTTSCNNDDEGSTSNFELDCTYLKVRAGSSFTYDVTGSVVSTITSEVVESTEIDGTLVAKFEDNAGGESFLTCEGDKFIITAQESTTIEGSITVENVLMTLDLGRPIGEEYLALTINNATTASGYSFNVINRYWGKVIETGLSMEVSGTTYNDVVKFELETFTENSLGGGEIHTVTTTYYIAPEAANIMTEIYDELQGLIVTTTTLTDYTY